MLNFKLLSARRNANRLPAAGHGMADTTEAGTDPASLKNDTLCSHYKII